MLMFAEIRQLNVQTLGDPRIESCPIFPKDHGILLLPLERREKCTHTNMLPLLNRLVFSVVLMDLKTSETLLKTLVLLAAKRIASYTAEFP